MGKKMAFCLVASMLLAGCVNPLAEIETIPYFEESESATFEFGEVTTHNYTVFSEQIATIMYSTNFLEMNEIEFDIEILFEGDIQEISVDFEILNGSISLKWLADEVGIWIVKIVTRANNITLGDISYMHDVSAPSESEAMLIVSSSFEIPLEGPVIIHGSAIHDYPASCTVSSPSRQTDVEANGSWSMSLGYLEYDQAIPLKLSCGQWTTSEDSSNIQILNVANIDSDNDGILDDLDLCPEGYGTETNWYSTEFTDFDGDGCHDEQEDNDDDNDGILDSDDQCLNASGWFSNFEEDGDQDGCLDASEDMDDDNDGVFDEEDLCNDGLKNWESYSTTDWDSDGCFDDTEDSDDDNDGMADEIDQCPRGYQNWNAQDVFDYDEDGCHDEEEDMDDDDDGVADYNETGSQLDNCTRTPLNATEVNEEGCSSIERDTDEDGVVDYYDACEGTPSDLLVNEVGCSDNDGDGVFSNVDDCPDSPQRWTANENGCTVLEIPIAWSNSGYGNGRMDKVSDFSFSTLDGSFSFQTDWTGHDVYMFLFKYTDSNGNTNANLLSSNPAAMIRKLPANTHLFYGSFDSTYHSDVVNLRDDVLLGLSGPEEAEWMPRIHFIDQQGGSIGGGLGDLIGNWGNLYYGIDRFQRSRELGLINDWIQSGSDPTHWAYEPMTWNYEFEQEIRIEDPGVYAVPVIQNNWHSGGWGAGMNSYYNATIDLPENISQYDTLEVFHEHACEDHRNIYQDANGNKKGCHEWDYLSYLYICNADNNSKCPTEFVRWITTYGREGRWITDVSPYLFMLQDDQDRRFRYNGANKGELTVTLLFSNWSKGYRAIEGEYLFSGGEFDGSYNDETKYVRQANFTVPQESQIVEIVATITGHGFDQDAENCAEFCDHEHHYTIGENTAYEWHPIVHDTRGCENEVSNGVIANQFGTWPYGRAGWCAGQDVKQWRYDITSWVDTTQSNHIVYQGLFDGQEYVPQNTNGGSRNIRAVVWVISYSTY